LRSRFLSGGPDLPLRRYRACRELLVGAMVHCGVLAALILALILFTHTVFTLFQRHGTGSSPWAARGTLGLLVLAVLLLIRRLVGRVRDVRGLQREIRDLARQIREGGEGTGA